jgi:alpha-D-xyloside xylohydrolase
MKRLSYLIVLAVMLLTSCVHHQVTSIFLDGNVATIVTRDGRLILKALDDNALRVKFQTQNVQSLPDWIYVENDKKPQIKVKDYANLIVVTLPRMSAKIDKTTAQISFYDADGRLILNELDRSIIDDSVQDRATFNVTETFDSPADEHLYGLGQFQDGYLDVRGLPRRLTQVNTQISIPFVLSSKGYGLLWNNYGLTNFNIPADSIALTKKNTESEAVEVDVTTTEGTRRERRENNRFEATLEISESGSYALLLDVGQTMARRHNLQIDSLTVMGMRNLWLPPTASAIVELEKGTHTITAELTGNDRPVLYYQLVTNSTTYNSPVADGIDYTVFAGSADEVIAAYRTATGPAPLMPRWALGYIHCRERFHSQSEIVSTAREFRRRAIPMDVIVQDWQYWGRYGWNAMQFDEKFYPNPRRLVDNLHSIGARLMISVWSKIDENSELGKLAAEQGHYIKNTSWIDFFDDAASKFYWENFSSRLLKPYGIDAWWQDATEPENDDLVGRRVMRGTLPGEMVRNVYPMMVNRTVYEGLCTDDPDRRPLILTRSGFSGIQRYGTALWSGDVGNDWETLRRQIVGGLGLMATGIPWWTYDAGGFFRPFDQYKNADYQECMLRWIQTATFLPLMRVHGYMSDTEIWRYGRETERIATNAIKLRYSLLPYIYSQAADVANGGTLMRPLVMDFAADTVALCQQTEFMFGPSLLVCPILEPKCSQTDVYLPQSEGGWYNFATGEHIAGGQTVSTLVSIEAIPVFVKAGSILPQCKPAKTTANIDYKKLDITIFPKANGEFTLYEDEGSNNDYLKGQSSEIQFVWNNASRTLTISERKGEFAGMPPKRTFNVKIVGTDIAQSIEYTGKEMSIVF